jgi:thiol reductant ABC exporter CydC subunit
VSAVPRRADGRDAAQGQTRFSRIVADASRPIALRLAAATLLGVGAMGCAIGLIATSSWLISRSAQRPRESALALAIVGVQFFALGRALLRYGERLVGHDSVLRVLARLRVLIYDRLERLAPAGLRAFRSGDLLARLVHDVDAVQDLFLRVLQPFAVALLVGVATALFVAALLPSAGLVLLAALLLAGAAVPACTWMLARRSAARSARARGELTATVVDTLTGAAELRVNGAIDARLDRVRELDAHLASLARAEARTAGLGVGLTTAIGGLAMLGSLTLGVAAVADGRLQPVLLAGLALVPLVAFELVSPLPAAAQALQGVRRSGNRLSTVLQAPIPIRDDGRWATLPSDGERSIAIRGLRCRYPGQRRWALDGVDLDLAAGHRVALVGGSGAGKSTLGWVLLRFLPYSSGSIAIDGVELAEVEGDAVRSSVGMIEQDPHVFDGSLAANLRLARPAASDDELHGVLARVRLGDWASSLPGGLATELGERGELISGGQRQRIALARALLADFQVLILDEPTEHLDAGTARPLLEDLIDAARGRSLLLITHTLDGLADFDQVVVLDRGQVVERGTHDELVRGDGRYAQLWLEQTVKASDASADAVPTGSPTG